MKKIILIILTLFLLLINTNLSVEAAMAKKDYRVVAGDGFSIKAILTYPKIKGQQEYKTVVLLHSLGYNSQWWETLPDNLLTQGYAVLTVDIRGHGASIYNKNLSRISWKSMTNKAYSKCPDDVVSVINYIKEENPKVKFFDNWVIVGSDIGASIGVIAADKLPVKPKTIIMLSPVVQTKGLYIPVSMAQLGNVDFLSITGQGDYVSKESQEYLKKFAQAGFIEYEANSKALGMLLLKKDPELSKVITEWINQYLSL